MEIFEKRRVSQLDKWRVSLGNTSRYRSLQVQVDLLWLLLIPKSLLTTTGINHQIFHCVCVYRLSLSKLSAQRSSIFSSLAPSLTRLTPRARSFKTFKSSLNLIKTKFRAHILNVFQQLLLIQSMVGTHLRIHRQNLRVDHDGIVKQPRLTLIVFSSPYCKHFITKPHHASSAGR